MDGWAERLEALERTQRVKGVAEDSHAALTQVASVMAVLGSAQTASTVVSMDLNWPLHMRWINGWIRRIVYFDVVEAAQPECTVTVSYIDKFFLRLLLPLVPLVLLGVVSVTLLAVGNAGCARACARTVAKRRAQFKLAVPDQLVVALRE